MNFITVLYKLLKNKYVVVGVPGIIINNQGEILLGKRNEKARFYAGYWGLPGGLPEYGEKMEDAVKRELKEELGVEVTEVKRAENVYERLPNKDCKIHGVDIPHYCKIKGTPKPKDETLEVKWFNPKQIKKMNLAYIHKDILKGEKLI
jgi:8-oxo-dGTP diphosphatase